MATIAEIRQQYPQYNDMSDQQLADKLYAAHYSDMPRAQFDQKVGLAPKVDGQPSIMDRIASSPVGRFLHDNVAAPVASAINGPAALGLNLANAIPDNGADTAGGMVVGTHSPQQPQPVNQADPLGTETSYQNALARNRNTPGYTAARTQADKQIALSPTGLGDQLTAPFNSTLAGIAGLATGGSLDTSNAAADAQEAAQKAYQAQHPLLSTAAQLAGGLLLSPRLPGPASAPAAPKAPSIADLRAAAKASYDAVDNSGVRVAPDALNRLGDSVQDSFGSRLDPTLHPDATAAYNRITQFATDGPKGDAPATFSDLDNLRRVVADAAQSTKPADKAMARMMMDKIDDFVGNLKPADLDTSLQDQLRAELTAATGTKGQIAKQIKDIEVNKPGALAARGAAGAGTRDQYMGLMDQLPQAETARQNALNAFQNETDLINAGPQATIDALSHAREMWSRASQASLIQSQIDKAGIKAAGYSQSGMENALRAQFKQLALNDRAMARLSPEVQQAVKDVAKGSPMGNVLRAVGKYAPHGPVSTAAGLGVGAMLGGPMGAAEGGMASLAVPMAGEAARAGATAMTKSAAQRALDTAALGQAPTISAPFRAPTLPTPNQLPYGLPLPLLLQLQHQ